MQLLRPFDERELELIIGGLQAIDVQDWKSNTRLKHCAPETPQVQWFWQVCTKSMNNLKKNIVFFFSFEKYFK